MDTLKGMTVPVAIRDVASLLQHLPGVGEKSALRFALFLSDSPHAAVLGEALQSMSLSVRPCDTCRAPTDGVCSYCGRSTTIVCVVHRYQDLLAVERSAPNRMRYFVLGKLLSPLEGVQGDDLPLVGLRSQVATATEVVLALPASVEGEATALLLGREFPDHTVTRLARGLPHGGSLEFADAITLGRALEERSAVRR